MPKGERVANGQRPNNLGAFMLPHQMVVKHLCVSRVAAFWIDALMLKKAAVLQMGIAAVAILAGLFNV